MLLNDDGGNVEMYQRVFDEQIFIGAIHRLLRNAQCHVRFASGRA